MLTPTYRLVATYEDDYTYYNEIEKVDRTPTTILMKSLEASYASVIVKRKGLSALENEYKVQFSLVFDIV